MEKRKGSALLLTLVLLLAGLCSASAASSSVRLLVSGLFSNVLSSLMKRLRTLTPAPGTVVTGRPMMRFESGYTVETMFDGSKLGIEPYSVEVSPSGELLVLDSVNSNINRISSPLSRYSRPKIVAGSIEGYTGHVDGKLREARMNHPKGFAIDDRGNIYVADTMNKAIRKISNSGVTTIAGGRWNRGGHMDGPGEDAKFSDDFEVVYISSSCSLLVIDRGSQAIREIQLHFDDCAYQYESGLPLGFIVLLAAAFFGYMLALLQRRVGAMLSSKHEPITPTRSSLLTPYQKRKRPVRPPLIPSEDAPDKQEEEGLFSSVSKLSSGARSSVTEILGSMFSSFRRKPQNYQHRNHYQQQPTAWPVQESYVIRDEDEPPPALETRAPTPQKTYAFMSNNTEKIHHLRQGRAYFSGWNRDPQQQQQQRMHQQQHLQQHRQYSMGPQTYYEQSCETANEIVFGAVQELDSKRKMVEIKAVNYGEPIYEQYGLRSRATYVGYSNNY